MPKNLFTCLIHILLIAIFLPGIGAACSSTSAQPTPTPIAAPAGWTLAWHDEFEGDKIDPASWTYDLGGWGGAMAKLKIIPLARKMPVWKTACW